MKALNIIARWIFVLCLPLLLITGSVALAANSLWWYESGFQRYNITQVTNLDKTQLQKAAQGLISYFDNPNEEFINVVVELDGEPFTLFNQREVIHLKDVKDLFWLDYKVALGTLIYVLAYAGTCFYLSFKRRPDGVSWRKSKYMRVLAKNLIIGSSLILVLMAALWIGSLINFEGLFIQFHLISFRNDFWELNPYTDYLLMMFPEGFWNDTVILIAGIAAAAALILGGMAVLHLKYNKKDGSS